MTLLTESAAREKWCPFARVARREIVDPNTGEIGIAGGCNRDALGGARNPASCRCLGSECMAWRWAGWQAAEWVGGAQTQELDRQGYCGLVGRPDMGHEP